MCQQSGSLVSVAWQAEHEPGAAAFTRKGFELSLMSLHDFGSDSKSQSHAALEPFTLMVSGKQLFVGRSRPAIQDGEYRLFTFGAEVDNDLFVFRRTADSVVD